MSITPEETIKILTAKAECMRRETSGIDIDCNYRNCDECDLCYKQGTTGDQIEALSVAISALQAQDVPDINVGDTVSRQAAIDIVKFECGEWSGLARTIVKAIKQLPSVQPQGCSDILEELKDDDYYNYIHTGHSRFSEDDWDYLIHNAKEKEELHDRLDIKAGGD